MDRIQRSLVVKLARLGYRVHVVESLVTVQVPRRNPVRLALSIDLPADYDVAWGAVDRRADSGRFLLTCRETGETQPIEAVFPTQVPSRQYTPVGSVRLSDAVFPTPMPVSGVEEKERPHEAQKSKAGSDPVAG